jgi:hypothetical protein
MAKSLGMCFLTLCLVAVAAAQDTEVRGSITGGIMMPQMELPYSNAWVIEENEFHKKMGHVGELGEIKPEMGYFVGYGVSVGEYSRFDAAVGTTKGEYEAFYAGDFFGDHIERTLKLMTHTVMVRADYTLFTPGIWEDRIKPELGFGLIFFISKYNTDQTIFVKSETEEDTYRGTAWARGITVGPELRGGVEVRFMRNIAAEITGTYFTAPMDLDRWYGYDEPEIGPTFEEYTGWAIWFGPRFYWP